MVRTVLLALAIGWTLLACSGDDESAKGNYGEQCGGGDCADGLVCQRFPSGNGICTMPCTSTQECRGALGPTTICEGGNCYTQCTDSSHCAGGLQCGNLAGRSQMICTP